MAAPAMTFGTAGNLRASASLGASATSTSDLDISTRYEAQALYKLTMGGTVAATAGLRIEAYPRYGSTPTDTDTGTPTNAQFVYSMAAGTASQVSYSPKIFLPTGKWRLKVTNLDATNAVTVEGTYDTVDSVS